MKIFVGGCVRNCESYIDRVFRNIENLRTMFDDLHVILASDESSDGTLEKLREYQAQFPKYDILINNQPMAPRRTENIANARNAVLKRIQQLLEMNDYDNTEWTHFIMMDFDDVCSGTLNTDVLHKYLGASYLDKWDALSFNRPDYYDIWALSFYPYVYSYWGWQEHWIVLYIMKDVITRVLREADPDSLVECQSAFNGFAMYRCSMFLNCQYDWRIPIQYMDTDTLSKNRGAVGCREPTTPFDATSDEEDCEHRHFHMQSIHQNDAKIRISPLYLFST